MVESLRGLPDLVMSIFVVISGTCGELRGYSRNFSRKKFIKPDQSGDLADNLMET